MRVYQFRHIRAGRQSSRAPDTGQRTTRYLRWVTPGASIARACSSRSPPDVVEQPFTGAEEHRDEWIHSST